MPIPHPATCMTAAWPTEKPDCSGNIMIAAKPILTAAIEVMAPVRIWADFGDAVDVDDGDVAEEAHGEGHGEAGDLAEQGSDQGGGGAGIGWRLPVDREHALQHLP